MSSRGRGRGVSNQPAWMTRGDQPDQPSREPRDSRDSRDIRDSRPSSGRNDAPRYDRRQDNRGPPRGVDTRDRRGGHGHGPPRGRGGGSPRRQKGVFFNSYEEERAWVEDRRRKRKERKSLFDVEPTDEQMAMEELQKAALASHGPNPNVFLRPEERVGALSAGVSMSMQPQQTRHARRLYVGQLAPDLSEQDIHGYFSHAVNTAMGITGATQEDDPILSVYINKERHFAFIEFKTMDVTTACLAFNGVNMLNKGKILIKRPNDYNPSNAPAASSEFMQKFDVSKLGIVSPIVVDSPNKIFIDGLPYHLHDEQVMELLSAFGKIKAFHLVKADAAATTSKGYCFVEYAEDNVRDISIMGLNGMDMGGGKVLKAKIASERAEGEGAEIGTAAIAGALTVTPIVPSGDVIASGGASIAPPIMRHVDGVDVEALIDIAMGNAKMSNIRANTYKAVAPAPAATNGVLDIANAALQAFYGSSAPSAAAAPAPTNGSSGKTRVLVLHNMVSNEDFDTKEDYEGLKDEVKEECEKYGSLISMKIPHPRVRSNFAFVFPCFTS